MHIMPTSNIFCFNSLQYLSCLFHSLKDFLLGNMHERYIKVVEMNFFLFSIMICKTLRKTKTKYKKSRSWTVLHLTWFYIGLT